MSWARAASGSLGHAHHGGDKPNGRGSAPPQSGSQGPGHRGMRQMRLWGHPKVKPLGGLRPSRWEKSSQHSCGHRWPAPWLPEGCSEPNLATNWGCPWPPLAWLPARGANGNASSLAFGCLDGEGGHERPTPRTWALVWGGGGSLQPMTGFSNPPEGPSHPPRPHCPTRGSTDVD